MRRHEKTPIRIALAEALTPTEGKRGRPYHTWLKTVANDLKDSDFAINTKHPQETLLLVTNTNQHHARQKTVERYNSQEIK